MQTINLILGRAGSGKGTVCKRYVEAHPEVKYIESGQLIRTRLAEDAEIQALINAGNLIPTEVICKMIVDEISTSTSTVIIDGYPRTIEQYNELKRQLPSASYNIILLDCDASNCMERLLHRNDNRNDDTPDAIVQRFRIFDSNINEMIEQMEDELSVINANDDRDRIYRAFEAFIRR